MQIGVTRALRGHVDSLVWNITPRRQEFADGAVLLLLRSEIDVGENALSVFEEVQVVGALQPIGDRAQDPQTYALRLGIADEIERLVDEFQIETWICRHLSHDCLLAACNFAWRVSGALWRTP